VVEGGSTGQVRVIEVGKRWRGLTHYPPTNLWRGAREVINIAFRFDPMDMR
jgi:hypothetical protein